jgi:hypothetical protein
MRGSFRAVELGPAEKLGWLDDVVASCFHEERLGPANEVSARTADPA